MPNRSLWKTVVVVGLACVGIILAVGAWLWWQFFGPLPGDAALRARFSDHRAELDSLAAMACADSQLVGTGRSPTGFSVFVRDTSAFNRRLTESELATSGRSAYGRLLGRAGLPSLSRQRDAKVVRFVVKSNQTRLKGILYSEKPVGPLVSSLDGRERAIVERTGSAYVALAPRWFLFLEPGD